MNYENSNIDTQIKNMGDIGKDTGNDNVKDCGDWQSRFSRNLENIRIKRGKSITEFSQELSIPKSTMQPILKTGNTTLNTAVNIASSLNISLDELVNGEGASEQMRFLRTVSEMLERFNHLNAEEQEKLKYHIMEIFDIIRKR